MQFTLCFRLLVKPAGMKTLPSLKYISFLYGKRRGLDTFLFLLQLVLLTPDIACFVFFLKVEERFRKTNQGSPEAQSKQMGKVLEPPVPSRSESFSNGNSEPAQPALQRPMEPQVSAQENTGEPRRSPNVFPSFFQILARRKSYVKSNALTQSSLFSRLTLYVFANCFDKGVDFCFVFKENCYSVVICARGE